jgi:hypothetical protein
VNRCIQTFVALGGLLMGVATAQAMPGLEDLARGGGDAAGHAQYAGVSWLGALSPDGGPVAYAFTRESLWDAQLPHGFRLRRPTPPPASVRLRVTGEGATGEVAMGVVQILEDTRGDGKLDFSYEEINATDGPVRAAVRDMWILYVHNLNGPGREALGLPYAGQLVEGFNLIHGSASGPAMGCPDHAEVVADDTVMTIRPKDDPGPLCWGSR